MLPAASIAIALAVSAPLPPYNVENVSAFPVALSVETNASYRPRKADCTGATAGKLADDV